jgi:hypothetical protein
MGQMLISWEDFGWKVNKTLKNLVKGRIILVSVLSKGDQPE